MYCGSEDLTFSEEEGLYVLKALEILLRFWRSGFRDLSPEELGSEDRDLIDLDLDGSTYTTVDGQDMSMLFILGLCQKVLG